MKNRAVRIALFLLVVCAFAGVGYEIVTLERQAAASREAVRAFDEQARRIETALRELRAAQFAYVAAGQGTPFWTDRATNLFNAIAGDLKSLAVLDNNASSAAATPAGAAFAPLDDLANLQRIDTSVRAYLKDEQRLLASDLVFSDLREADQALTARIEDRRGQVIAAGEATADMLRTREAATLGGGALFSLLVLLLLLPGGRSSRAGTATESSETAPPPVAAEPAESVPMRPAETPSGPPLPVITLPWSDGPAIDIAAAAALCTAFAGLRETSELPALLERAADLLHAAGIIVWVDDTASGELRPAASFGYPASALARIHGIPRDSDNATASAYRERTLRVVEGDGVSNGAIAAPLLGPNGCVGVMAAEVRGGHERQQDLQALATILAAQLATLVATT